MLTLFNFVHMQRQTKPTISAAAERVEKLRAKKRKLDSQTPGPVVDLTSNYLPCDHEDTKENGFWKEVGKIKLVEEDRYVQYVQCVCMHMMSLIQSSISSASYVHCSRNPHCPYLPFCRKILESSPKWLTDNIIMATQELLRRKW